MSLKAQTALGALLSTLAASGCGQMTMTPSGTAEVKDISSMQRRDDGRFDVICASGAREIVPADYVQAGNVCPAHFLPKPGATAAAGADRAFTTRFDYNQGVDDLELLGLGQELWSGFASFDVAFSVESPYPSDAAFALEISDGTGGTWRYGPLASTVSFRRLIPPVRLHVLRENHVSAATLHVNLSAVHFDVTGTTPPKAEQLAGRADVTTTLKTLGADLDGAPLSFLATGKLYDNFADGDLCTRLRFVGKDGKAVVLDHEHPAQKIVGLVAPVQVNIDPVCQSSRLPAPENKGADFQLKLSDIQVGTPTAAQPSRLL